MNARADLTLADDAEPRRIFGKVSPAPPRKPLNKDRRPREHLTEAEVNAIAVSAGKRSRYSHRDKTMILLCFRHGLRVGDLQRACPDAPLQLV